MNALEAKFKREAKPIPRDWVIVPDNYGGSQLLHIVATVVNRRVTQAEFIGSEKRKIAHPVTSIFDNVGGVIEPAKEIEHLYAYPGKYVIEGGKEVFRRIGK